MIIIRAAKYNVQAVLWDEKRNCCIFRSVVYIAEIIW